MSVTIKSEKGVLYHLENIDRRLIYVILFIATAVPLIRPIGLPLSCGEHATALYKFIDGIEPGSTIVWSWDYSASTKPECQPQGVATSYHAMKRDINVVFLALWIDGAIFADECLREIYKIPAGMPTDEHPDYGVKFINLGYIAGGGPSVTTMATDLHSLVKYDHYGNALEDLPLAKGIMGFKDVDLIISLTTGGPGIWQWWEFVRVPYGTPLGAVGTGVQIAGVAPLYPTDLVGYLGGLRGAAEYEFLVRRPGTAAAGMDAQALAHLTIVLFVVIGNITYLSKRFRRTGR